jgi:DsbC/DsbD-like thiol-disulfide interchange protein
MTRLSLRAAVLGGLVLALIPSAGGAQSFLSKQPARLSIAVDAPDVPVTPGARFELALRITPNPGIHVYAPGNANNIPVSIVVTPPAGVAFEPAKFPKAEDFFFGPLAETMKVYSKPFVVTVPARALATLGSGSARGTTEIAVAGAVKYQACDDRVCFPPQSTPFETRLAVRLNRH